MEEFLFEGTVGAQKQRAAVMIGRMRPATMGHYKVIAKMKAFIRNNPELNLSALPFVVVVEGERSSQDKEKNPISAEDSIKFMQASGKANGVQFLVAKSGFAAFEEVRKAGFEPIAIAAGSDRAEKYLGMLNKYFTNADGSAIKHVIIPGLEREEAEAEKKSSAMDKALAKLKHGNELSTAEVSGSLARHAVSLGYEEEFAAIVGLQDKPKLAKLLFDKIQKSMGDSNGTS